MASAVHELRQPASSLALLLAILERKAGDPALTATVRAAQGAIERLEVLLPALPLACTEARMPGSAPSNRGQFQQEVTSPADSRQAELWPASAGEQRRAATVDAPVDTTRHARTLIVEDRADVAQAMAELLEDCGQTVVVAGDAHQALTALAAGNDFSAVIADYGLPGGASGLDVLAEAGRRLPLAARVLISGDPSPELTLRAQLAGLRLLAKPPRAQELLAALAR